MTPRDRLREIVDDLVADWEWNDEESLGDQISARADSAAILRFSPYAVSTRSELEALDKDTLLMTDTPPNYVKAGNFDIDWLPAVVILPGSDNRRSFARLRDF